ncbi:MAG: hypothetical protein H6739_28150 [Alphaproteobacteria bacterium]|nr:hypothetical protein [Alphaproteobacteria bacterium]
MPRISLVSLALLLSGAAFAQDADELLLADSTDDEIVIDDSEFEFLRNNKDSALKPDAAPVDDFDMFDGEDNEFSDFTLTAPPAPAAPAAPAPTAAPVAPAALDIAPLTDTFSATVRPADAGSVVVELPVMVAAGASDVSADFWLIGEVYVGGQKVAETRQLITGAGVSAHGPTMSFLKVQAPVPAAKGQLEVRVSRAVGGAAPEALYARTASWSL